MRINLEEGTITFKVKKDKVNWKDSKTYKLFNSNEVGSVSINKIRNFLKILINLAK